MPRHLDSRFYAHRRNLRCLCSVSFDVLAKGGEALAEELALLDGCKTGHAKTTSAPGMPARRIIHTVGPVSGITENAMQRAAAPHTPRAHFASSAL